MRGGRSEGMEWEGTYPSLSNPGSSIHFYLSVRKLLLIYHERPVSRWSPVSERDGKDQGKPVSEASKCKRRGYEDDCDKGTKEMSEKC